MAIFLHYCLQDIISRSIAIHNSEYLCIVVFLLCLNCCVTNPMNWALRTVKTKVSPGLMGSCTRNLAFFKLTVKTLNILGRNQAELSLLLMQSPNRWIFHTMPHSNNRNNSLIRILQCNKLFKQRVRFMIKGRWSFSISVSLHCHTSMQRVL